MESSNMQVNRVLETCVYVNDLGEAERFYTQVLGLAVFARLESRHVFFRCGDGMFLVFNPEETIKEEKQAIPQALPHGAHGSGHVAFAMDESEIDAWRDHLQKHGVRIEREVSWPEGGFSIYFRDPAGNCLELATAAVWQVT